ncbi:MAG: hypothetical protein J5716_09070 [Alphaproteobacteria bacterium]|nr:hypothetical protein [Alphaproteobacteria bacterium]
MLVLKVLLCFAFLTVFASNATAESIAGTAEKIAKMHDQKAELEKDKVKTGEKIQDIGNLTIEDFLELEAVPDGMKSVSAQALHGTSDRFDFMTQEQMLQSIATMRRQGIALPEDLEEKIKKNPEKASELMSEALDAIPPTEIKDKKDIAQQRKNLIKDAENNLGIDFKNILEQQKRLMTPTTSKGRRRGRGKK